MTHQGLLSNIDIRARTLLDRVKINAPAYMLHQGALDLLIDAGVHPEVGLDARALEAIGLDGLHKMAHRLRHAGLRPSVHGPFFDLAPGSADRLILDASRKRYHRALEAAAPFQPEHIVFHVGYESAKNENRRDQWTETSLETWQPILRRARELGIPVVFENTHELEPEEFMPIMANLAGEGAKFCLDVGHAASFSRAPLSDWLKAGAPLLNALHLHDNFGLKDDHLAIGQGSIDFKCLFDFLIERHLIPAVITLEPHREDQIAPSLSALARLWPWPLSDS